MRSRETASRKTGVREREEKNANKYEKENCYEHKIGVYELTRWLNRVSMYSFAHLVYKNSKTCINFSTSIAKNSAPNTFTT